MDTRGIVPLRWALATTAVVGAALGVFGSFSLSADFTGSAAAQGQSTEKVVPDGQFAPDCRPGFRMCGV